MNSARFTLFLWALALPLSSSAQPVNGLNVSYVEYSQGGSSRAGTFTQTNSTTWVEESSHNNSRFTFRETQRDDWSVYLLDESRNISIQLDLHRKEIVIYWERPTRGKLYNILAVRAGGINNQNFYMILASDSQYPRALDNNQTERHDLPGTAGPNNRNHLKSMNSLIEQVGKASVEGVIMNGDITEYGHEAELSTMEEIYGKLSVTLYPGLGNHDYANNVDDCWENNCANRMVLYLRDRVRALNIKNFDYGEREYYKFPEIVKEHYGSLAYSWDIKNVHFVQLNNFPTYTRSWSSYVSGKARRYAFNITSSLGWLEKDLAKARSQGKAIIINFHDPYDKWESTEFKNIIEKYRVSAIFFGHYHNNLGIYRNRAKYGNVPAFYCGSSIRHKYLLVNFTNDQLIVDKVYSDDGGVRRERDGAYSLITVREDIQPPPSDGSITFFNEGGYVAKYELVYYLDGKKKTHETGKLALGNKKTYTLPGRATRIRVKGMAMTGLVWDPWKTIFDESVSNVTTKCYKSYNTTLNPKWNNKCN